MVISVFVCEDADLFFCHATEKIMYELRVGEIPVVGYALYPLFLLVVDIACCFLYFERACGHISFHRSVIVNSTFQCHFPKDYSEEGLFVDLSGFSLYPFIPYCAMLKHLKQRHASPLSLASVIQRADSLDQFFPGALIKNCFHG